MSSSVFKEYQSPQADSNVVVFINKDGSVSVDQSALQELLVNDATETNTSLSVIRVESPTPSFQQEIDEQEENHEGDSDDDGNETDSEGRINDRKAERMSNVCVTVENFYNPDEARKLATEILSIAGISEPLQIKVDYEFQRYVVANDHCYTSVTSPSQPLPKNVAPELQHFKPSLP